MVATVMSTQASATCTQQVVAKQTRSSAKVRPGATPTVDQRGNAGRRGARHEPYPSRELTLACLPRHVQAAFRAPFSGSAVASRASSFSGAQISAKTVRSSARKSAVAAQAKVR